jgi:peptidoglycan hydrolase CwlO-like protein
MKPNKKGAARLPLKINQKRKGTIKMNGWHKCKVGNTTATLLLAEVKEHGVPSDQNTEERNNLADVIGNMTTLQLQEAFEMDENRTLFALRAVWNIMDVIHFYISKTGYQSKESVQSALKTLREGYENTIQVKNHAIEQLELNIQEYTKLSTERKIEIETLQNEITRLKAQLWDLSQK